MSLGLFVERLRRQVNATGPHHGPCFRIDRGLRKVGWVVQRLEYPSPALGREVDIPDRAVAQQQPQRPVTDHRGTHHDREVVLVHVPDLKVRIEL